VKEVHGADGLNEFCQLHVASDPTLGHFSLMANVVLEQHAGTSSSRCDLKFCQTAWSSLDLDLGDSMKTVVLEQLWHLQTLWSRIGSILG
jgi:hypothetical protein